MPWLSIEAELSGPDRDTVLAGIAQIQKGDYFAREAQNFLQQLSDYPASYFAPRKGLGREASQARMEEPPGCTTPGAILARVGAPYPMQTWMWDLGRIEALSQVDEHVFDPLSVVSYLIGKRLELEVLTDPYRAAVEQKFDKLRVFDEGTLFELAALVIRQTHHITSSILPILRIAHEAHPRLAESIKHFMDEEIGHDKLMERSLSHLGRKDPATIPVLPSTAAMMKLFELAARHSPLAFVSCIGMFEGSSYPDSDPLADLLEKTSIPGAAYGYKAHFKINRDHNHKDEVFAFAAALPALSQEELTLGVRLFELTARASQIMDIEINQEIDRTITSRLVR
ncbi:iron-containing redox enzyme family protein [Chondromyces apiculatus]|uniref:iron-containing redox enzyme family protein n=1 Tax=Chondromyces apiculatus TaxID=51 RepID=UPI0012DEDBD0|nr:iron-containing redox enzyme family protein [Chondromyces apiculatus]